MKRPIEAKYQPDGMLRVNQANNLLYLTTEQQIALAQLVIAKHGKDAVIK